MEYSQKKSLKTALTVIGIILEIIAVVKLYIIGFYPGEVFLYYGLLLVGLACLVIARKIRPVKPGEDPTGLGLPGKWKCHCGVFNDDSDVYCGNCGIRKK